MKHEFCAAMTLYAIIITVWPAMVVYAIREWRFGGWNAVRKWWRNETDVGQFIYVMRRVHYSRGQFCVRWD